MSSKKTPLARSVEHQWMTRAEVAEHFRVTTRCVDDMRADGRLAAYTLGDRIIRFKRDEVETALQPSDTAPEPPAPQSRRRPPKPPGTVTHEVTTRRRRKREAANAIPGILEDLAAG